MASKETLSTTKLVIVVVAVALAAAAVAYGVGRLQGAARARELEADLDSAREDGRQAVAAAERRHEQELEAAAAGRRAVEERLRALERRAGALEARRQLGLVLLSVDDRNFGIAEGHLERARESLAGAGLEGEEAAELLRALRDAEVVVAGDLSRRRFRELVNRLDRLVEALPEPEPATPVDEPEAPGPDRE